MADPPIVCTLDQHQLSERRQGLLAELVRSAQQRRFSNDGVLLVFAGGGDQRLLWQVLDAERQCCRFLRFRLAFEPDLGPITLEITGPLGTREFLQSTLGL